MVFRKPLVLRITFAALGIAGLWLAWAQQQPRQPLTINNVTSEGVIVVDDKYAQDAPDIMAKIKTITDKPVRYVLNTHQHGDHTGGNEAMMAANAQILITKQARAN